MGAKFDFSLDLFERLSGDYVSFRAAAEGGGQIDLSTGGSLETINLPEPATLSLLAVCVMAMNRGRRK